MLPPCGPRRRKSEQSSRKGSRRPRALAGQGGPVGGAPEWGGDEGGGNSPPTNLFLDGEEAHGGRRWFGELPRAVVDEKRSVGPTNGGGAGEFNERRRRTGEKCGGSGLPETASSGSRGKVLDTTQVLLYACWPGKNLGAGLVGNWRRRGSGQPTVRPGAERAARAVACPDTACLRTTWGQLQSATITRHSQAEGSGSRGRARQSRHVPVGLAFGVASRPICLAGDAPRDRHTNGHDHSAARARRPKARPARERSGAAPKMVQSSAGGIGRRRRSAEGGCRVAIWGKKTP
jgi:hypothetical protein